MYQVPLFTDRRDCGRRLAQLLAPYRGQDVVVLGLPRGGVPVADEVARGLGVPLDIVVARKLGAPENPEFGIGAIAPGVCVLDEASIGALGIRREELDALIARESAEVERRLRRFRGGRPPIPLAGRTAILVDDGVATGVTTRAAARSVRRELPRRVVLAVGVIAPEVAASLRREDVDDVVAVATPRDLIAVGMWFAAFAQVPDEEVVRILDAAHRATPVA